LTENLGDGVVIEELKIENPFFSFKEARPALSKNDSAIFRKPITRPNPNSARTLVNLSPGIHVGLQNLFAMSAPSPFLFLWAKMDRKAIRAIWDHPT